MPEINGCFKNQLVAAGHKAGARSCEAICSTGRISSVCELGPRRRPRGAGLIAEALRDSVGGSRSKSMSVTTISWVTSHRSSRESSVNTKIEDSTKSQSRGAADSSPST